MRPRRFKVEHLRWDVIMVTGGQAHHALNVLRLKRGDAVILFDGKGNEAEGEVDGATRNFFTVRVLKRATVSMETSRLSLVVAMPKGDRADWLVEKCAELGVSTLIPLRCGRAQVIPGDGRINRWRRKADEAAKQSVQSRVLNIEIPMTIAQVAKSRTEKSRLFFGDPNAANLPLLAALQESGDCSAVTVFIGPEGGFTDTENSSLTDTGVKPVRLAESILRIETAAIAAASLWAHWKCGRFDASSEPS